MNVLAWLDSLHTTEADGAVTNRKWPEAQEARAAVAELVEAAKLALDGLNVAAEQESEAFLGFVFAGDRLRTALARVQGGAA